MLPGQPVVFDVVDQLQLPDRRRTPAHRNNPRPGPAAQRERQRQHRQLQHRIAPERVRRMPPRPSLAGQHRRLGPPGRRRAFPQHPEEEAVEALVVARRHRIARGADMAVMDQQMLGPEMRIEHAGQQQIAQPALQPGLSGASARGHRRCRWCPRSPRCRRTAPASPSRADGSPCAHPPDHPEDHRELHREPDQRDQPVPEQLGLGVAGRHSRCSAR